MAASRKRRVRLTRPGTRRQRGRVIAPMTLAAACGMAAPAAPAAGQLTEPFPAVFDLESLSAARGGDGSLGFVLEGVSDDWAGWSVASAGDVNGDGVDDVVAGAPGYYFYHHYYGEAMAGRAYVVFGRDPAAGLTFPAEIKLSTLDGETGFRFEGDPEGVNRTGTSVAAAGDVNGDGVGDIIIGAPWQRDVPVQDQVYVVFGRRPSAGFPPVLYASDLDGFRLWLDGAHRTGQSVAAAGDFNADGVADAIISSHGSDPGGRSDAGASYIVFGDAGAPGFPAALDLASLDVESGFRLNGVSAGDVSGATVSSAGDVNGDGVDDVLIGAPNADPGGRQLAGESYVVFGRAGGGFPAEFELASLDGTNGFRLNGDSERAGSGRSVARAGDVNNDGIDDLIIAAPGWGPAGRPADAFVVFGRDTTAGPGFPATIELAGLDGVTGFRLAGSQPFECWSVASAGDINGDGVDDIIVGGYDFLNNSYVVFGRDTSTRPGFPAVIELSTLEGRSGFRLVGPGHAGYSVASAGDVNGDGVDDLIIGAHDAYSGRPGKAYVVFGRVPDAPCFADCDGSGELDFFDFLCFQNQFAAGDPLADCDESGELDFFDFLCFQNAFAEGCP